MRQVKISARFQATALINAQPQKRDPGKSSPSFARRQKLLAQEGTAYEKILHAGPRVHTLHFFNAAFWANSSGRFGVHRSGSTECEQLSRQWPLQSSVPARSNKQRPVPGTHS